MKHIKKCLKLLSLSSANQLNDLPTRTITNQYRKNPEFAKFLDECTAFLPKSILPRDRWHYYINGDTKPHKCACCGKIVADYFKRFCSHACSTSADKSHNKKTGPKVDLVEKERKYRKLFKERCLGYKLLKYDVETVKVKHSCGIVFEARASGMVSKSTPVKCSCLHKKAAEVSASTIKARLKARDSAWKLVAFAGGDLAVFKHRECKHVVELPHDRTFDLRCPTCYPNTFASRERTPLQYAEWLVVNKPEYTVVGTYVDSKTCLRYHHSCGGEFETKPSQLQRKTFQCPCCSRYGAGAYRVYEKPDGTQFKLRGKEVVALNWLLENTKFKVEDIEADADGTVPKFHYFDTTTKRNRMYRPDFYIRHRDLIIEVKDVGTLGLGTNNFFYTTQKSLWETNCLKAKSVIAKGYKFQMLVFTQDNFRISLPKEWWLLSHKQILAWCKEKFM